MVSRDGEPVLVRGPSSGSMQRPNEYEIRTTPLPSGDVGENWRQCFSSQFTGPRRFRGWHDGKRITIECSEDDASELVETVDAAIEYANNRVFK